MFNKIIIGMIIFGINIISCDDSIENTIDTALNGTWYEEVDISSLDSWIFYLKLNNGNYETYNTFNDTRNPGGGKGIYTANNGLFTMVATHYYLENEDSEFEDYSIEKDRWYTKNELKNSLGLSENIFEEKYGYIFKPFVYNYGVNQYNLIFTLVSYPGYPEGSPYSPREVIYFKRL